MRNKFLQKLLFALVLGLFAVVAIESYAKNTGLRGFNANMFRPQTDGYGIFNAGSSEVLPHLKYSFGMYTDYSNGIADAYMPARRATLGIIDNTITSHFMGAIGLFDFADIGLSIPVTYYQEGRNYNDLGKYKEASLGDIDFDTKFKILPDKERSIGVALQSRLTLPTGNRWLFNGDNGPTWEGRLILDKTFWLMTLYANTGYRFLKKTRVLSTNYNDCLTFGGGLKVNLPFDDKTWDIKTEVVGSTVVDKIQKTTTPLEVRAGLQKNFKSGISLTLGGGAGLTGAIGSSDYRVFAGLGFNKAKRDKHKVKEIKVVYKNGRIYFSFDSFKISDEEAEKILAIAQLLVNDKNLHVLLKGYTDNIGPESYNINLSRKRAVAVRKILISSGVNGAQVEIKALGESSPLESNSTTNGRRLNRRVEFQTF